MLKESVAVVLCYKQEIVLVKRRKNLRAFSGYDAFPGGKIEASDMQENSFAIEPSIWGGAVREVQEELGIDLLTEKILVVKNLGKFLTPSFNPRRFLNTTLIIELSHRPNLKIDKRELESGSWNSSLFFLQEYEKGNLLLVPPVKTIIEALAKRADPEEVFISLVKEFEKPFYEIAPLNDLFILPIPSNTLPPATTTNAFIIDGVLVDPSPKDGATLKELMLYLKTKTLRAILLTHHHPDHREYAREIALDLGLPIMTSSYTAKELKNDLGEDYFEGISHKLIKEGDVVGEWLTRKILVLEVPGHDEGQLALASQDYTWIIVGDLIQGLGTVVIAPPEGNMKKYFNSLKRCIALNPKVIIPSHGIALGSAYYLEQALEHRVLREKQVLEVIKEGKTADEALSIIYPRLHKKLIPLALCNINSHIEKLKEEGKI